MEKLVFQDATLALLDGKFNLNQVIDFSVMDHWLAQTAEVTDFEKKVLERFQKKLVLNVHDWNEAELLQSFIGPVFALVDYTTKQFNFFAERNFSGKINDVELYGKPDGMIASGFREPKQPYFCFQEYKRSLEQKGDPAGQCLAAMLAAQEINQHQHPVYGCYVVGANWYFMTLQEQTYCITQPYVATRNDILDIFRILKALKQIIINLINQPAVVEP